MLRYKTGVAGSAATASAAARYFMEEALKPENELLAKYYSGEATLEQSTGMDDLAQAVLGGDLAYSEAVDMLLRAHTHLFDWPDAASNDAAFSLERRIQAQLDTVLDRQEKRETIEADGGTVVRVREDINPQLAHRLGIDTHSPLSRDELAHLLGGMRADGDLIEGKQIQQPMKSVVEIFGLDPKRLPTADEIALVLDGKQRDGAVPEFSEQKIEGAKKRFLNAFGLPHETPLTEEHIQNIKDGKSATGRFIDDGDVLRDLNATRPPIAYTDMIWSADKSVSVAWALAPTEAERTLISEAHRAAVSIAMAYVEEVMGTTTKGANRETEKGCIAYVAADHYTSRPVEEVALIDSQGRPYTEFQTVPMKVPDMNLHTHALMLNAVLTETGRMGAMDRDKLDGLVKEFGAVYQAANAQKLRESGIEAVLDKETGAARIPSVERRATEHFSKRGEAIKVAARKYAADAGLDWETMTGAHRIKFLRRGVEETRNMKWDGDGESHFASWRRQAIDISYHHRSVLRPGQEQTLRPEAERIQHAYEVSRPLIEDAFARRAVLNAQEFREYATRGLIEAGISNNPGRDIKLVMKEYSRQGVMQNGEMTNIWFGKDVPVRGKEKWSVTTGLHLHEEREVIAFAKTFSDNKRHSFTSTELERSSRDFLKKNPKINANDPQWVKQRAAIEKAGTGGALAIIEGVAGAGKTTLLSPLVAAARARENDIHGIARGWKQAVALQGAGLKQKEVAANAVFFNRVKKGKIKLSDKSIVFVEELSQIGRQEWLRLMALQKEHRFRVIAIGDPKQGGSIDPAVIDLLVKTLGDKVPKILTSVRQNSEREREIAGLFREGKAREAISMKLEDKTAELVAGGRDATIKRTAEKWMALTKEDPTLQPTIGVVTNRDAHDIGVAIRRELQAVGRIEADQFSLPVIMRGETEHQKLALAVNDRVRVFNRVWVDGHFASNGDILDVVRLQENGMFARNEAGREAFIPWSKLQGRFEDAPRLAYGHALTIDASQGINSRHHIDPMLSGSRRQQGGTGYVNESRMTETTWLFVNEAIERQQIHARMSHGDRHFIEPGEIWAQVAQNLSRPTNKAIAVDFMKRGTEMHQGSVVTKTKAMEPAERREKAGVDRLTIRQRMTRVKEEWAPIISSKIKKISPAIERHIPRQAQRQSPASYRGPSISH